MVIDESFARHFCGLYNPLANKPRHSQSARLMDRVGIPCKKKGENKFTEANLHNKQTKECNVNAVKKDAARSSSKYVFTS